MSKIAKFSLLFIVFVDLLGQGLVFPIINAMIMEPTSTFLPHDTSDATRYSSYGLVVDIGPRYYRIYGGQPTHSPGGHD